jgi:hypothetical protein
MNGCGEKGTTQEGIENLYENLRDQEKKSDEKRRHDMAITVDDFDVAMAAAKTMFNQKWSDLTTHMTGMGIDPRQETKTKKQIAEIMDTLQRELEGPVIHAIKTIEEKSEIVEANVDRIKVEFKKHLYEEITKDKGAEEAKVIKAWLDSL